MSGSDLGLTDVTRTSGGDDGQGGCGAGCMCSPSSAATGAVPASVVADAAAGGASSATATDSHLPAASSEDFLVTGMTCAHCISSVTEEIGEIEGVDSVEIDLNVGGDSRVTVSSAGPIDEAAVRAAVAEAGYALADSSL